MDISRGRCPQMGGFPLHFSCIITGEWAVRKQWIREGLWNKRV